MKQEQNNFNIQMDFNNSHSKEDMSKVKKAKFFIVFKLVLSFLYFIPTFLVIGLGMLINIFLLISGSGASKFQDSSNVINTMVWIALFSAILLIFVLILFILTLKSTIKFFKNKYNRKLDLTISILFVLLNIVLTIFSLYLFILYSIISIILLANIVFIIKHTN